MSAGSTFTYIIFLVIALLIGFKFNTLISSLPKPTLEEPYWGPGKPVKDDTSIKPFKVTFSNEVINDLKSRLNSHRSLTPPMENTKHHYGINTNLLKSIIDYWKTKYDFKNRENFLNKYPQFITQIQGLNIHYLHIKPEVTKDVKVLPMMLLHGWPGSVREFYEIIPLLTKPFNGTVFELIIPSLPGYGFSQGASKPGLSAANVAVVLKNLMIRIGFDKWYLQGGDWGAAITSIMATLFPENILGAHSNMCYVETPLAQIKWLMGSIYPPLVIDSNLQYHIYPVSNILYTLMLEFGYMHLQATKPDTLGVGLNDSPVGLAAYILEKFITWTAMENKDLDDGGLTQKYTYDALLDNIMIYWVSNSITTSVRLYSETLNKKSFELELGRVPVTVPYACAKFKQELFYQTDFILKDKFTKLVHSKDYDVGGHFVALEVPDVLAKDIFEAIGKMQ